MLVDGKFHEASRQADRHPGTPHPAQLPRLHPVVRCQEGTANYESRAIRGRMRRGCDQSLMASLLPRNIDDDVMIWRIDRGASGPWSRFSAGRRVVLAFG